MLNVSIIIKKQNKVTPEDKLYCSIPVFYLVVFFCKFKNKCVYKTMSLVNLDSPIYLSCIGPLLFAHMTRFALNYPNL